MDSLLSSQEKNSITEPGAVSFKIYEQLRAEIQHLKQELVSVSEQNVDLAIQLGQIDELNDVVAQRNSQIERLNHEAAALNKTITDLKAQLSQETEHAQKSDSRIEELLALEAELQANLKQSQEERLDLKQQIDRHLATIANLQELLSQAQASNARHVAALESLEAYISKPEEQEDPKDTPPLLQLKNVLHELLGTAGQVIFGRACRLVGAEDKNLASATPEQIQKAAASIISPALRLCRNEAMVKDLQERIHSICATVSEIGPELKAALSGPAKTTAISSSAKVNLDNQESTSIIQTEEQETQELKKDSLIPQEQTKQEDIEESNSQEELISTSETTKAEDEQDDAQEEMPELSIFANYEYEEPESTEEQPTEDTAPEAQVEKNQSQAGTEASTEPEAIATELEAEVKAKEETEAGEKATTEASSKEEETESYDDEDYEDEHLEIESGVDRGDSIGDQLVRNTEVPNRTLSDKRAQEFNNTFKSILDGTQTKFQDHVIDFIYKMTWKPDQISERDRACTRPKQINKLSQSIIRSSVDFDLDQIVEWLNYLVMPKRINTYVPEAKLAELSNINTRQDSEVQDLLNVVGALNKRIFRKDRLKIHFFDGPCMYLSYSKAKEPHLYFNNKIVANFNLAQQTFFAARALFSLQRGYFELETALQSITEQPEYDPLVFGSTLLKRSLSLALEKSIAIPNNLAEEIQNAWSIESSQELLSLVDRCYKATKFAQFSYIKELLSTATPFQQSMNIEGDAFTLKFCNIYDASLAIVKLLNGCELAKQYATEGFNELFSDRSMPQTYLQQRLSNLWLSYYINGDEFAF